MAAHNPGGAGELIRMLESGRGVLRDAPRHYGRELEPEHYWWLGVGLAAVLLTEVNRLPLTAARIEKGIADLITGGITPERVEQVANELAQMDSLGLLWPLWRRGGLGWERAGIALHPGFGPEDAYWVCLAHIAVALLSRAGRTGEIPEVAGVIGEIITGGLRTRHEEAILRLYGTLDGVEPA